MPTKSKQDEGGEKPAKKAARPKRAASKPRAEPPGEVARVDAAAAPPAPAEAPASAAAERTFAGLERIVVFRMDEQRYALPIEAVQEIQQIVAVSEIPDASRAVMGVINLRGEVVPAVDLRRLVGVAEREYGLQTPMVFCRTSHGLVALIVDEVEDVVDVPPGAMQEPSKVYALSDRLIGVCRLEDGLVFVFDIDKLMPGVAGIAGGA